MMTRADAIKLGWIRPAGDPSRAKWIDQPTLKLDSTGRRAAAANVAIDRPRERAEVD
jgi:hypothetical protein